MIPSFWCTQMASQTLPLQVGIRGMYQVQVDTTALDLPVARVMIKVTTLSTATLHLAVVHAVTTGAAGRIVTTMFPSLRM